MMSRRAISLLIVLIMIVTFTSQSSCTKRAKPLNVIIVFHNHQPFYENPLTAEYVLPWVRLHAAKDYFRMPYIVSQYPDVHISFDLSGSLLAQIEDYVNGAKDRRQVLSEKKPEELTQDEILEILAIPGGFFDLNWDHILKKIPLYVDLLNKRQEVFKNHGNPFRGDIICAAFTKQEILNIQTLFNLFWLDIEYIKGNEQLRVLYEKAMNREDFTENDKMIVLSEQMKILSEVVDMYEEIHKNGQADVFTTPYSHPISPLLADFGWIDDLEKQVKKANEVFKKKFGFLPEGVWASECAINDEALKVFAENGWKFTISDADNLEQLGIDLDSNLRAKYLPYNMNGVTVFFRDKYLSDGISFRYSGKTIEEALEDVEKTLRDLYQQNTEGNLVYTIALDGENAWEYYENDGNDFLRAFYSKLSELQKKGIVVTRTCSEYIKKFGKGVDVQQHSVRVLDLKDKDISSVKSYSGLPSRQMSGYFGESSWINPTLDTWIGELQENIAWQWLSHARNQIEQAKTLSEEEKQALFEMLMRAEGSDWFWWYGSDQDSGNDRGFDRLFKMYLAKIYELLGISYPDYLFGNFFPDGTPYSFHVVELDEGSPSEIPFKDGSVACTALYSKGTIKFNFTSAPSSITMAVFKGQSLNTFFSEQEKPSTLNMSPFPYEKESIGMPIDLELTLKNFSKNNQSIILDTENLNRSMLFVAFASFDKGRLVALSNPVSIKLPLKVEGEVICELLDESSDDNGPGSYLYPLNEIFKTAGAGLFDLLSLKIYEAPAEFVFEYKMSNLGGNPWNGPNGISFQILETYIDYKSGGKVEAIDPKGSRVQFDRGWDLAFRIAGWSYGNYMITSDDKVVQGEMQIRVEGTTNTILVSIPKSYMALSSEYKPYVSVISGSQDGYSTGYFRPVAPAAAEWLGGGAEKAAYDAGVSPNVYDIFTEEGQSQRDILSSFNVEKGTYAIVPMLPVSRKKPSSKLSGKIVVDIPSSCPPGSKFTVRCEILNIGSSVQNDLSGDEFSLDLPKYVKLDGASASSGLLTKQLSSVRWNGRIEPSESVEIKVTLSLDASVPNGYLLVFKGNLLYDGKGEGVNNMESGIEASNFVRYPVSLEVGFDADFLLRNGERVSLGGKRSSYRSEFEDVFCPLEELCNAIGAAYSYDKDANKLTISFIDFKYEHWIGQNKALVNGSAIPFVPGKPEIRSFVENGEPMAPLSAISYGLKLKYRLDIASKVAYLEYVP